MNTNTRILHIDGHSMKYRTAIKGIEQCALAWVEEGVSVRNLTLAESLAARNEQARLREPLEYAELPGIVFQPPVGGDRANFESLTLVREARKFAREAA